MSKRLNRFGPALGESLQSFIFRVLCRNGHNDFSTVLTHGGWGNKPSVPLYAQKEFEVFSSRELLRVFETSTIYDKRHSIFDCHFEHLFPLEKYSTRYNHGRGNLFREAFYPKAEKHYAGRSMIVRYCVDCIRLQIRQNGFAFFKKDWDYQVKCDIHSKPLRVLCHTLSLPNVVAAVKQVLKGELPEQSHELREHVFDSVEKVNLVSRCIIKLAPCAKTAIINYLTTRCKFYPKGYTELVDYGFFTEQGKIIFAKWRLRQKLELRLEEFYEAAMEQDYDATMAFLNQRMDLIRVRYVDDTIQSDTRWLLKSKVIDCSACAVTHNIRPEKCSASKLIYLHRDPLIRYLSPSPFTDICNQKLIDLKSQIIKHQNYHGVEVGERFVDYKMKRAELIKQTGGVNAMQEFLKSRRL